MMEPLLGYVIARLITGRKISTLMDSQNGEQYTYSHGDQIYDYHRASYVSVIREENSYKIFDYKTKQYYTIQPKRNGLYVAHLVGSEQYYEITVNNKWVIIMNVKEGKSKIYYFQ